MNGHAASHSLNLLLLWYCMYSHAFPTSPIPPRKSIPASATAPTRNLPIKLILLDRDGVINEDVGSPGVTHPQQLQLTPQAGTAIGNLKRAGYSVALITNQSCVGKGLITSQQLDEILDTLQQMCLEQDPDARWDRVYVCTTDSGDDHRKKPSPGMIKEACRDFQVSPAETVFVGDTHTDLQAAVRGGVPVRILVATGYGMGWMQQWFPDVRPPTRPQFFTTAEESDLDVLPFLFVQNLQAASEWILETQAKVSV
jgi:D-glycero-D-manno-heptose 1,7-bisphosphate phosphatase